MKFHSALPMDTKYLSLRGVSLSLWSLFLTLCSAQIDKIFEWAENTCFYLTPRTIFSFSSLLSVMSELNYLIGSEKLRWIIYLITLLTCWLKILSLLLESLARLRMTLNDLANSSKYFSKLNNTARKQQRRRKTFSNSLSCDFSLLAQ